MSNVVTEAAQGIKQTLTKPKKAARNHFWVFLAVVLFLAAVSFVILENKRPGAIKRFVQNTFGRIPGAGKHVAAFLAGALGLLFASGAEAAVSSTSSSGGDGVLGVLGALLGTAVLGYTATSRRRKFVPLTSGSSGSTVTTTPGSTPTKVPWTVKDLPTREGKYFWYLEGFWVKTVIQIDQAASTGGDINPEAYGAAISSFELRSPNKLGTLFSQSETSGQRLNLIDGRIAEGYKPRVPAPASARAADGDYVREVWHWIPFTQRCFENPLHFAPLCALLEGALLDIYVGASNAFDFATGGTSFESCQTSVIAQCRADEEARLHTPVKWGTYEPVGGGSTARLLLEGGGGRSKLNGVQDNMGLAALYLMSSKSGLPGSVTFDVLNRIQADFLDLASLEFPEVLVQDFVSELPYQGGQWQRNDATFTSGFEVLVAALPDYARWPYTTDDWAATDNTATVKNTLRANLLFYPLLMPGIPSKLSKISRWGGTNTVVLGFSSSQSQQTFKFGSLEVGQWDPVFMEEAKRIIFGPGDAPNWGWEPKLNGKQKRGPNGRFPVEASKFRFLPWVAKRV